MIRAERGYYELGWWAWQGGKGHLHSLSGWEPPHAHTHPPRHPHQLWWCHDLPPLAPPPPPVISALFQWPVAGLLFSHHRANGAKWPWLFPKWHPIPYEPWSKVVHYIGWHLGCIPLIPQGKMNRRTKEVHSARPGHGAPTLSQALSPCCNTT